MAPPTMCSVSSDRPAAHHGLHPQAGDRRQGRAWCTGLYRPARKAWTSPSGTPAPGGAWELVNTEVFC